MLTRLSIAALLLLVSCSSEREPIPTRTVSISAAKLAEIRAAPKVRVYPKGGAVSYARISGIDGDPWPQGVLLLNPDPYLELLGFKEGYMLAKIDGKPVHELMGPRWQKLRLRLPTGWASEHYNDLLSYLFLEHQQTKKVVSVYVGVSMSADQIKNYKPVLEHWQVNFER